MKKKWFDRLAWMVAGMLIVFALTLRRADKNLQPTPPTQIAFTGCFTGDTFWVPIEGLSDSTVMEWDSCYMIHILGTTTAILVKESPFSLLERGGAK